MGAKQLVGGALVGAGLVYLLDPEHGPTRRAQLSERLGLGTTGQRHYGLRLGDIAGLEAAHIDRPADTGKLARLAGGLLFASGMVRRGRSGRVIRTAGLGLVARGVRVKPPAVVRGDRRRTIDIQKTVHVEARPERVFAFWSEYDNLPAILPNVREVRDLGHGRSRWVVTGPGDQPVAWTAVLTTQDAPRLLAWRSEDGAILEHAGVVRFTPEGTGTRIDFRFCYSPPAGRHGRALVEFFGADPRARVTEDFGRLKALLESTPRSEYHEKSQP
jgi:uncharacterized membrane protein